jgi:hypothetical protein
MVGDARDVVLRARTLARLVTGRAGSQAIVQRYANRICCADGKVIGTQTARSDGTLHAGIAIVCPVATGGTTISDFIDPAARGAFLTCEAIGQVQVVVHAIGGGLAAHLGTHGGIGRTSIDAIDESDTIKVRRTGLQFVQANAIESAGLAGIAIHGRIACTGSSACTIEARHAGRTNRTTSAAIRFVVFDINAFGAAFGQTRATRGTAGAIRANFAHCASLAAHAAIAWVELHVDTNAIALRCAAGALRIAIAVRANLTHGTCNAACSAVAGVVFRVDACIGTFRRTTGAIECAFATRTHFARAAYGGACSAIQTVIGNIDAEVSAFRCTTNAGQTARAVRANFALCANGSACAAIADVGL